MFKSEFKTIDLGLRLGDLQNLDLESEPVALTANKDKIRETLRRNGATEEEIIFLLSGRRVELNAMTSDQFVGFVERKLTEVGIAKVVPPNDQLAEAYRLFARSKCIEDVVEKAIAELDDEEIAAPGDIEARVRAYLAEHPDEPWEDAARDAAGAAPDDEGTAENAPDEGAADETGS